VQASDEPLIRVEDLRVRYGERAALDGVSFAVGAGEVVGLLGPNGAGKTTTLSVLATLRRPSGGAATVAGHAVDRAAALARRALGLVPQSVALYPPSPRARTCASSRACSGCRATPPARRWRGRSRSPV
jgi:ABC-2 type transport system ATP-binding protein